MIYTRKIEIIFDKETKNILEGQSKICNWLYNQLLAVVREDKNNDKKLLSGRNLRDYATQVLKEKHPFLKTVHSTVIKEPAYRIVKAYQRHFDEPDTIGFPRFRSWNAKGWYCLTYDDPAAGYKLVDDKTINITLGKILTEKTDNQKDDVLSKKNLHITGILREKLSLENDQKIKVFRIVKQRNKFYAIFTIEATKTKEELEHKQAMAEYEAAMVEYKIARAQEKEAGVDIKDSKLIKPVKPKLQPPVIPDGASWVSIDPNHKNFCVGYDYLGRSFVIPKFSEPGFWDKRIDVLKSKRDKCTEKYEKSSKHGNSYVVHSRRWNKLDRAIKRCEFRKAEQVKHNLYRISHRLFDEYDLVLVGDYTPSGDTANQKNMHRSMLNNTFIGEFRRVCGWVAVKRGKYYRTVSEYHSTKSCCVCGHLESKEPSVREFECVSCGFLIDRDVNAAVNIAKNFGLDVSLSKKNIRDLSSVLREWRVFSRDLFLPALWPRFA